MDVGTVISSYSMEGEVRLGGEYAPPGRGDTRASVGATGRYADRPTITYQPLTGDKFARSLMAPIPVSGFLFLLQSGDPTDLVLRICVNSINGLENDYGGAGNPRAGSPKFRELMTAMQESQPAGGVGFRVKATKDKQIVVMFIRPSTEEAAASSRRIRVLLGLEENEREFHVESGSFPEDKNEIAILTRSILRVMIDLGSFIDVPAGDIAEGASSARSGPPSRSACFLRCSRFTKVRRRHATPTSLSLTATTGTGSTTATSGPNRSFPS